LRRSMHCAAQSYAASGSVQKRFKEWQLKSVTD
jgi:hypothetical protein